MDYGVLRGSLSANSATEAKNLDDIFLSERL